MLHKKIPELRNWNDNGFRQFPTLTRFFLDLLMFHRRFSNCRPQNSAPYNPIIWQLTIHFLKSCQIYCTRLRKVTTVTNPILDFTFLSTPKSGKSRTDNPFLGLPKGTHPYLATLLILRRSFYTRWRILLTSPSQKLKTSWKGLLDRIPPWSTPWH